MSRGRTVTMASEEDTNETSHQLQIPTRSFLSGPVNKLQSILAKDKDAPAKLQLQGKQNSRKNIFTTSNTLNSSAHKSTSPRSLDQQQPQDMNISTIQNIRKSGMLSREGSKKNLLSREGSKKNLLSRETSKKNLLSREPSKQNLLSREGSKKNLLSRETSKRDLGVRPRAISKESKDKSEFISSEHRTTPRKSQELTSILKSSPVVTNPKTILGKNVMVRDIFEGVNFNYCVLDGCDAIFEKEERRR